MFELDKILVQENMDLERPINDYNIIESSYMSMTLRAISEHRAYLREGTKEFYVALAESSGNPVLVTEAFSDFFKKVIELIKRFLKFIQRLFDKFIAHINGLVKSEKYLKKHKKAFNNFKSEHEFDYNGYIFTIDPAIPIVDVESRFEAGADSLKKISDKFGYDSVNKDNILANLKTFRTDLNDYLMNDYQDVYRGFVIGKDPIDSSEYNSELFSVFRNDSSDTESITIDKPKIDSCLRSFENYSDVLKKAKDTKAKIEKEYKAIQKNIESFSRSFSSDDYSEFITNYLDKEAKNITAMDLSAEAISEIKLIMKAKAEQVTYQMDIHSLAFTAKLQAIKDQFNQDKDILYKAIYKMGIREAGAVVDIEDVSDEDIVSKNLGEDDETNTEKELEERISEVNFMDEGIEVVDIDNNRVFLDEDYSLLDIYNPTEKLINAFREAGILQVQDGEEDAFSSELLPGTTFKVSEDLPNDSNITYDIFLANEACEDIMLFGFIKEQVLRTSGEYTTESYRIIQESVADGIKAFLRKIWNAIVTIWNKFSQTMEELFANDVKYLEKYKDIILKKKVKIESIDCWSYFGPENGVKLALSDNMNGDLLTVEMYKENNWTEIKNNYLKKIHAPEIKDGDNFQDAVLSKLRGEETNYKTDEIEKNMKNMYDFCYNYKKSYKPSCKKLLDAYSNAVNKWEKELDKLSDEIKKAPENDKDQNTVKNSTEKDVTVSVGDTASDNGK